MSLSTRVVICTTGISFCGVYIAQLVFSIADLHMRLRHDHWIHSFLLRCRLVHQYNQPHYIQTPNEPTCTLSPEALYGCILIPCHMTVGLMRRFSSSARTQLSSATARLLTAPRLLGLRQYQRTITDVRSRPATVAKSWFTSSAPCFYPELDEQERQRLNERNLKLGNSMLGSHLQLRHAWHTDIPKLSESFMIASLLY